VHEPDFFNNTPFKAEILPILDREGRDCRLVVIKGAYRLGTASPLPLLEEQRDVRLGNEPWGDPKAGDIRFPSDLVFFKPGTDFLVAGHAKSPWDRPAPFIDVAASCAGRSVRLRTHGPRRWRAGVGGVTVSQAEPTKRVALCWGLAYGGYDGSDPARPLECLENPAGRGVARDPEALDDLPAPQIEDPAEPIRSPNQGVRPAGLGPLGVQFEPRRSLGGTYDRRWLDEIHPALPPDYQPAFANVAPREFVFDKPLRGREPVSLEGVTPEGRLTFEIPLERPFVEWTLDGKLERHEPHLDTVLTDVDENVLELVWRVCIPTPPKMRKRFTLVEVFRKEALER
jgi:hypothetical protein